jgi:hypothetical protein
MPAIGHEPTAIGASLPDIIRRILRGTRVNDLILRDDLAANEAFVLPSIENEVGSAIGAFGNLAAIGHDLRLLLAIDALSNVLASENDMLNDPADFNLRLERLAGAVDGADAGLFVANLDALASEVGHRFIPTFRAKRLERVIVPAEE